MSGLNIFKDKKTLDIIDKLKLLGIKKYHINLDYTVDVNENVQINDTKMEKCPVKFREIKGNFIWANSNLNSVNGLPSIIRGTLVLSNNNLRNLIKVEGSFDIIDGGIILQNNKLLTSLYGLPDECLFLDASNCDLQNLIGSPSIVEQSFNVSFNRILSLEHGPKMVKGTYNFSNNQISSLKYLAKGCKKYIYNNNPIIDYADFKFYTVDDLPPIKGAEKNDNSVPSNITYKSEPQNKPEQKVQNVKNIDKPKVGDYVKFIKSDSKHNNYIGVVSEINIDGYKVDFYYENNTEIWDRPNKVTFKLIKIQPDEIVKVKKPQNKNIISAGDKITYSDKGNYLDGWEGEVTRSSTYGIDIKLYRDNQTRYLYNVQLNKLIKREEIEYAPDVEENIIKNDLKKGDVIIYKHNDGDDAKNSDYHMRRGEITFCNTFQHNYGTYDIKLYTIDSGYDKYLYSVKPENLLLYKDKHEIGDKVIYINGYDVELDGKSGTVTDYNKGKYKVSFIVDGKPINLKDVPSEMLATYNKKSGTEAEVGDTVIYTKYDSKYYGCKGIVKEYNDNEEKPYLVELFINQNKIVKIKTKDFNLDVVYIKTFRKNDTIQFVDDTSPYDGYIGKVVDRKDNKYDIEIKNLKGDTIYLTTDPDKLILLEESDDVLTINKSVKYDNPQSKYHNKIGTYLGERIKDGKKSDVVQFETPTSLIRVFVEPGTLKVVNDKPSIYNYTTTAKTTVKKKKKEDKADVVESKPILVYNRRKIARKKYVDKNKIKEEEIE